MSTKEKTILVVDDDEDIIKLLTRILTTAGHKVVSTTNPAEGRKILEEVIPHVIISDLHMEPENGFEFIQSIKAQKQYSLIPIIVLSALNDFKSVKKAIALGVNDYVIKPLQAPMLLRKLKKVLHNKDFMKWEPGEDAPEIEVTIDAQISSLGEAGCKLKGPFKLSPGIDIKFDSPEMVNLGLDKIHHRPSQFVKTYARGGMFLNDITFVGISESISSKVRQFVSKRKML